MDKLKLPDKGRFQTATVPCQVCGLPVRYYVNNFETGYKRQPPTTHGGRCRWQRKVELARKKLRRYKRQRDDSQTILELTK